MDPQREPRTEPGRPAQVRGIPLGRWAGVTMSAHWTVLFTLALFADLLATAALPTARPHHTALEYWTVGALTAVVFLVTVLLHELGHALVARHYGMRVRSITLWMLGGLTELDGDPPSPRADIAVAVAGPATSVGLGVLSGAVAWSVGAAGLVGAALVWLAGMSVLLGLFNLLPAPPLDGGRVLRGVLWWRHHDRARAVAATERSGRVIGAMLIALGILEALAGDIAGLWFALIGWMIINSGAAERYAQVGRRLGGLTAAQVMTPTPVAVPDWWTLEQFVAQLTPEAAARPAYPLTDFGGAVTGVLRLTDLDRVPADQRADRRLREIVRAGHTAPLKIDEQVAVTEVARLLPAHSGVAVVLDPLGHPVGIITAGELDRAAQLTGLGWQGRPGSAADRPPTHAGAGTS